MVKDEDLPLLEYADELYHKALKGKKVDSKIDPEKDIAHVDLNTLQHPGAKEFEANGFAFKR